MLFLLTGEVQIGKTRWLEKLVADLAECGVLCARSEEHTSELQSHAY